MNINITIKENEEITGNYVFEATDKQDFYYKLGISLSANLFEKDDMKDTGKITINWN